MIRHGSAGGLLHVICWEKIAIWMAFFTCLESFGVTKLQRVGSRLRELNCYFLSEQGQNTFKSLHV